LRTVLRKAASLACAVVSACGPTERPRVTGFGFRASTIWLAEMLLSPAGARLAVIDRAAERVIAFSPKNLSKRVIVVSFAVTPDGDLMPRA